MPVKNIDRLAGIKPRKLTSFNRSYFYYRHLSYRLPCSLLEAIDEDGTKGKGKDENVFVISFQKGTEAVTPSSGLAGILKEFVIEADRKCPVGSLYERHFLLASITCKELTCQEFWDLT